MTTQGRNKPPIKEYWEAIKAMRDMNRLGDVESRLVDLIDLQPGFNFHADTIKLRPVLIIGWIGSKRFDNVSQIINDVLEDGHPIKVCFAKDAHYILLNIPALVTIALISTIAIQFNFPDILAFLNIIKDALQRG